MVLDLFMRGQPGVGRVRIRRVECNASVGLPFEMKGHSLILWQLEAGKLSRQCGINAVLNLVLQFHACRSFDRRQVRIAGVCNESALRFLFDAVSEMRDETFDIHQRDSSALSSARIGSSLGTDLMWPWTKPARYCYKRACPRTLLV